MPASCRFLALGDSYTVGESVPPGECWPRLVAEGLAEPGRPVEVEIVAATGWTAGELLAAVEAAPPRPPFDLVSLLIGVNDQYRGLPLQRYETALDELLAWSERFAGPDGGRFAVSIPDWGVTPFAADRDRQAVARDIDRFNRVFRNRAEAGGLPFVDVTALSRCSPDLVAADGLHPDGRQYRRWAEHILPVAIGLLTGRV